MIRDSKQFDFFISYAGPDIAYAQTLRDTPQPVGRIFLAPQSELLGEDWPTRLTMAVRDAWVTLALVSQHTPAAHFQMEEILLAIQESRAGSHVVIPIRLAVCGEMPPLPVGRMSKNCLDLHSGSQNEISSAIDMLLAARDDIRSRAGLGWRTSRELTSSDPLRDALERVKTYEQSGLLRERTVEEIQIILLKHHLIGDERGT
ncbi:MAG: toll/interleukin-1 receptor domain-containing protein [Pseudonocardiaceae bacterium]